MYNFATGFPKPGQPSQPKPSPKGAPGSSRGR